MAWNNETKVTHGYARAGEKSPEYKTWERMRNRCNSPANKNYARYGGRGIKICARWDSFANFLADMGPKPSPKHSIERIDNNKGYSPDNCRWAPGQKVQMANMCRNVYVEVDGRKMCMSQAAALLALNYSTVRNRTAKYGWSIERAFEGRAKAVG